MAESKCLTREELDEIEKKIGLHPDFPRKGILFRDIMPILADPLSFSKMMDALACQLKDVYFDRIIGIESRGFLIGTPLAIRLGKPFIPIRKKGKLPGAVHSIEYQLEYGLDTLEVQKNSLPCGSKCLIIDDLIATGGSMAAGMKLVELNGSEVAAFASIIELKALNGRNKLGNHLVMSLFQY